jgi:hypothetical protein
MVVCDALENLTSKKPLEDVFFELYSETVGDAV